MTTYLTWRLVFAGEVVVVLAVLLCSRVIPDARPGRTAARLDGVGRRSPRPGWRWACSACCRAALGLGAAA